MKITVLRVVDDSFDGKDGRVTAAKLTFKDPEGVQKELPGYGPSMVGVMKWQPGEEKEIEPYTTGGGKAAFKVPREGGGGGRGGFGPAAFRNTAEGHASEQMHMDRRTALMQAVAYGTTTKDDTPKLLKLADDMYDWLRKTAR